MTVDLHPWTDEDVRRYQDGCNHWPDHTSVEVDDVDDANGTHLMVAECHDCGALIQSGYVPTGDGLPEEWCAYE